MDTQVSPLKVGIKYGVMLGLASIILNLIAHYAGIQDLVNLDIKKSVAVGFVTWAVIFGFLFVGIKYFRENNEGLLTLGEGMSVAIYIGLVSGVILALYMIVYANFLMPDMMEGLKDVVDFDELPEDETEMANTFFHFVTSPFFMAMKAFISRLMASAIFGLIASLILRKE